MASIAPRSMNSHAPYGVLDSKMMLKKECGSMKENNISEIGIMLTEKCNFRCEHCMFACTNKGQNMLPEVLDKISDMCDSGSIYEVNIYGGEPFLNLDLFKRCFEAVWRKDMRIFISTNGSFLLNDEAREYVLGVVLPKLDSDYDECSGIRISNSYYHRQCQSPKLVRRLNDLKNWIDDPYSYTEEFADLDENGEPDYDFVNPFYNLKRDLSAIYIDDQKGLYQYGVNPSGRGLMCNINDHSCCCPMTMDIDEDYINEFTHINIRPNGDVSVCCTCDGCIVANVLEDNFSFDLVLERTIALNKVFSEKYDVYSGTKMIDLCEECHEYNLERTISETKSVMV